ncbi:MAG: ribulose-phosphate 3-epimerase, partial [Elusimicrobiaceae bacterium]|nr:ribulose-phosphate 3-epimerase [Elusimicrobiaceae bacterium]
NGESRLEDFPIWRGVTLVLEPGESVQLNPSDFVISRPLIRPVVQQAELSASMMCADFSCLRDEVRALDEAGVDSFHIDIMDGSFVDNFGMGYQDMECIKKYTSKPVEAHLMVKRPYNYLDVLFNLGIDTVYIHPEVDADPATTLEKIRQHGVTAGIAINPGTSIPTIEELLNMTQRVLVLGVNPGHAGRKYQPYVDKKIEKLLALSQDYNFEIYLDGAVTLDRIEHWTPLGVKGYVLGTATLFGQEKSFQQIVHAIKADTSLRKE